MCVLELVFRCLVHTMSWSVISTILSWVCNSLRACWARLLLPTADACWKLVWMASIRKTSNSSTRAAVEELAFKKKNDCSESDALLIWKQIQRMKSEEILIPLGWADPLCSPQCFYTRCSSLVCHRHCFCHHRWWLFPCLRVRSSVDGWHSPACAAHSGTPRTPSWWSSFHCWDFFSLEPAK